MRISIWLWPVKQGEFQSAIPPVIPPNPPSGSEKEDMNKAGWRSAMHNGEKEISQSMRMAAAGNKGYSESTHVKQELTDWKSNCKLFGIEEYI